MSGDDGWPSNEHGVYTPMGHVEQVGNLAHGLRQHPLARAVVVLVIAGLLLLPVLAMIHAIF